MGARRWGGGLPPGGFTVRDHADRVTLVGWTSELWWIPSLVALPVLWLGGRGLGAIALRAGLLLPTAILFLACLAGAASDLRQRRGGWHVLLAAALCPLLVLSWRWLVGVGEWAMLLASLPEAALLGLLSEGYRIEVSAHGVRVQQLALLLPTGLHHFPLDCAIEPYLCLDSDDAEGVAVRDGRRSGSEICVGGRKSAQALAEELRLAVARYAGPGATVK